jgi:hypothetical protein
MQGRPQPIYNEVDLGGVDDNQQVDSEQRPRTHSRKQVEADASMHSTQAAAFRPGAAQLQQPSWHHRWMLTTALQQQELAAGRWTVGAGGAAGGRGLLGTW